MKNSEKVAVYQPVTELLDNKNPVDGAYAFDCAGLGCNIHRGATEAMQQVFATTGSASNLAAFAYFNGASLAIAAAKLKPNTIVLDDRGEAWLVAGRPSVRDKATSTNHVKALLILQIQRPEGVPTFDEHPTSSTGLGGLTA